MRKNQVTKNMTAENPNQLSTTT